MAKKVHRLPGVLPQRSFTQPKPTEPRRSYRWIGLGLLVVGLGGFLYWFFLLGPYFAVEKVEVVGVDSTIIKSVSDRLIGRNIFTLSSLAIEQDVKQVYPPVASVTLVRGLPRVVRIQVAKREPELRWQQNETVYIIDASGQIFEEGEKPEYAALPKVFDRSQTKLTIGAIVVTPAFIQFIQEVSKTAPGTIGRPHTLSEVTDTTFHVDLLFEGDIRIRLTTQRPADEQLKGAATILKAHPEAKLIDVRVVGRGYWK